MFNLPVPQSHICYAFCIVLITTHQLLRTIIYTTSVNNTHKSINACLSSKSRVKMPSAQSPCRQTALHQAKLLPLISVTATGLRYTSKGRGSSEERVLVCLMIYLFSNSYRSSNPFTLLPSPSTKVFNFFLDSLFFFFFPPSLNAFYPISKL